MKRLTLPLFLLLTIGTACTSLPGEPTATSLPTDTTTPVPTETPLPTSTATPVPTETPTITPTEEPDQDECVRWDEVNESHVGETICVYGEVYKKYSTETYAAIFRFAEEDFNILFRVWNSIGLGDYLLGITSGDCIETLGRVQTNNQYFFINPGFGRDVVYSDRCE